MITKKEEETARELDSIATETVSEVDAKLERKKEKSEQENNEHSTCHSKGCNTIGKVL